MKYSKQLCETFDRKLASYKAEIKDAISGPTFRKFESHLNRDEYYAADGVLKDFLKANSVIDIHEIEFHWPSLDSQSFIAKMEKTILDHAVLRSLVDEWNAFMSRYDGVLSEIIEEHRRRQAA